MKYKALLIVLVSFGLSSAAEARTQRVQQIPNGSAFSCTACHVNASPSGPANGQRNDFGAQVEANLTGAGSVSAQEVDWLAIYELDADGDGFTNGEELGDPNGEWQQGEEAPATYEPSNPADASDTPAIATECPDGQRLNPLSGECESEGGEPDAGGADAGGEPDVGGGDDAGMADVGMGDDVGGDDGSGDDGASDDGGSDEGCSTTGVTDPASSAGLAALFLVGLAALRRRFSH